MDLYLDQNGILIIRNKSFYILRNLFPFPSEYYFHSFFFIRNITRYIFGKLYFVAKINLVQFFSLKKREKKKHIQHVLDILSAIQFRYAGYSRFSFHKKIILYAFTTYFPHLQFYIRRIFILFCSAKTNIEPLTPHITAEFFRIKYSPKRI